MACRHRLFLLLAAACVCLLPPSHANQECEQLGFTGLQSCADCESMAEYVKDEELLADCKKCCVKAAEDTAKYTHARLDVCPFRLNGLPQIQDFVDKHAAQYGKALKVSRTVGAYPKLTLTHKKSGAATSVRIDQWKVATIHEYLRDKLEGAGGKVAAAAAAKAAGSKVETSKKKK